MPRLFLCLSSRPPGRRDRRGGPNRAVPLEYPKRSQGIREVGRSLLALWPTVVEKPGGFFDGLMRVGWRGGGCPG